MRGIFFALILWSTVISPVSAAAETNEVVRGEVVHVVSEERRSIAGTDAMADVQTLSVRLLEGSRAGDLITMEHELTPLAVGDVFFLNHMTTTAGEEFFLYKDVDRRGSLFLLGLLFCAAVVGFTGRQGVRSLLSLALSVAALLFVLVPLLLRGYDAALVSFGVAGIVLVIVLYGTHGFSMRSTIAFAGTWAAVALSCLMAWLSVRWLRLSGFGDDASVYLNFATNGSLDFSGLLLGGIIIGMLGVLDDVAVTQVSVVGELKRANPSFSLIELYRAATRVGRDHVSSLVNTLAFAYVGAALPLVLFLATSAAPTGELINQEIVAAELVRIIIGSIGVILTVPLATMAAAWYATHYSLLSSHDHEHPHPHHH